MWTDVLEALSSNTSVAKSISKNPSILQWLLNRATQKEKVVSQNKQYSAEVLAILMQTFEANVSQFIELDGVDSFLQALAPYRKRDPAKGSEEEEFVENVFDGLTLAINTQAGKEKFLDAEGVELCLIMLKEGKMSRPRALRLLDHALSGEASARCAEQLVNAAGLKPMFSIFMKKQDGESTEHLLGILASMLRSLPANTAPRIRLLGKFVEKDYEKLERLATLRWEYSSRVSAVDRELKRERLEAAPSEQDQFGAVSRRLDAGLFPLQVSISISLRS